MPEGISGGESTGAPFEAKTTIALVSNILCEFSSFCAQVNHVQGAMQDSRSLTLSKRHDFAVDVKLVQIEGL